MELRDLWYVPGRLGQRRLAARRRVLGRAFDFYLLGETSAPSQIPELDSDLLHLMDSAIGESVPSLPRLLPLLIRERGQGHTLVGIAARDTALSSRMRSIANYRYIRRERPVVRDIGQLEQWEPQEVSGIAVAALLQPVFLRDCVYFPGFGQRLFLHSLECAHACRTLARGSAVDPEEAFAAGMLHDLGKLAAFRATQSAFDRDGYRWALCPSVVAAALESYRWWGAEQWVARWGLPVAVEEVTTGRSDRSRLSRLVEKANAVSESHTLLSSGGRSMETHDRSFRACGTPPRLIRQVFPAAFAAEGSSGRVS